jgi:hypothetical protein
MSSILIEGSLFCYYFQRVAHAAVALSLIFH